MGVSLFILLGLLVVYHPTVWIPTVAITLDPWVRYLLHLAFLTLLVLLHTTVHIYCFVWFPRTLRPLFLRDGIPPELALPPYREAFYPRDGCTPWHSITPIPLLGDPIALQSRWKSFPTVSTVSSNSSNPCVALTIVSTLASFPGITIVECLGNIF